MPAIPVHNRARELRWFGVRAENRKAVPYQPFATGWLQGRHAWGRPTDVLVAAVGALPESDQTAGAIFRISYRGAL